MKHTLPTLWIWVALFPETYPAPFPNIGEHAVPAGEHIMASSENLPPIISDPTMTVNKQPSTQNAQKGREIPLPSGIIDSADVALQNETSSKSPPLVWLGSKDLIVRQPPQRISRKRLALKLASHISKVTLFGIALYSTSGDCKYLHEEKEGQDGMKCVAGAIATAIVIADGFEKIQPFFIELGKDLYPEAIIWFANYAFNAFGGRTRIGFGPFLRATAGRTPGAARPPTDAKREDGSLLKRSEELLSRALGTEIRSIGFWDGNMTESVQPLDYGKRALPEKLYPVFGLNIASNDMHLAVVDQDSESSITFKLGYGPGPATAENVHRLKGRDYIPSYNNYYFDKGGLDIVGQSYVGQLASFSDDNVLTVPNFNQDDWESMYRQVACYMLEPGDSFDAQGLWFEVSDGLTYNTDVAGAIAPFSATQPSIIQWMRASEGLQSSVKCTGL